MLQSMARIAGVAGCTVSLISTFPASDLIQSRSAAGRVAVVSAARANSMVPPIQIAPDDAIRPAVATVSEFAFDASSGEYISDESILKSIDIDECAEPESFALEGYVTSGNETLRTLSKRYSLDPEALALLNGRKADDALPAGTRVSLYRGEITLYTASRGETLEEIARKFGTDALLLTVCNHPRASTMEGGERLFIPQGILEREGEADVEEEVSVSPIVIAPQPQKTEKVAAASRSRRGRFDKVLNFSSRIGWPVSGKLSSRFGWRNHPILNRMRFHSGIDISAPRGAAIRAVAEGRVIYAGWRSGSGRTVVIRHEGNLVSIYAHCSRLSVDAGQHVAKGQTVGRIGSSGLATGNHLHFALERGKTPVNPLKYLR
ncbi:MAG: M23 family metallopeptidase [Candidatus Wallbacteria bacterium]|nr:M23 family metallopeptidase [Candidatus Wallbacteria bacterium]